MLRPLISARLTALGLSQSELARRAGVQRSNINAYLAGKRMLGLAEAEKVLSTLGLEGIRWKRRAKKAGSPLG